MISNQIRGGHIQIGNTAKRQLIALLFSDLVGYGTVTNEDESRALELLTEFREIFRRVMTQHGGRENKTIGDAFFVEFGSSLDAVRCAVEIQTCLYERNLTVPENRRLLARIGIHLGDVVLSEGDSFGEGVNVAARIEAFAEPGGICVSQQVADQLSAHDLIRLKGIGKKALKHIRRPTSLYKVVMAWEQPREWLAGRALRRWRQNAGQRASAHWQDWLLDGVFLCVLGVFGFLTAHTVHEFRTKALSEDSRSFTAAHSPRRLLGDNWQYALAPFEAKGDLASLDWKPFIKPYWPYADELSHPYWIRHDFEGTVPTAHPAIVLGPITGAHRVYLNGHFIGGSNYTFTLASYAVDPTILNEGRNTLVVKIDPKPSLTPGIVNLPQVPAFLGDFNDVYQVVVKNEFYFHVVQTVYLMIALLSFAVCLAFYIFNASEKKYLYFAIYLLLGSMTLLHSNGLVFGFLEYHLARTLRLFGLSVSSLVLLSTYFHLNQRRAWETASNAVALVWGLFLVYWLLPPESSVHEFLWKWNAILIGTAVHGVGWVLASLNYRCIQLLRDRNEWRAQWGKLRYELVLFAFGLLTAMLAFGSLKAGAARIVPLVIRNLFFGLGTLYPFLFASSVLSFTLFDYIVKSRSLRRRQRLDDCQLEIANILRHSASSDQAMAQIQRKASESVQAERSSLYLWEESTGALRAHSLVGSPTSLPHVQPEIPVGQGILGYVCQNRAPILVWDLASDVRFQPHLSGRVGPYTYRTGSCMLFPLVVGNRVVGVLTLADKRDETPFDHDDFSLLNAIARDLSMLIQSRTTGSPSRSAA